MPRGSCGDRLARQRGRRDGEVVGDLERSEAGGTDVRSARASPDGDSSDRSGRAIRSGTSAPAIAMRAAEVGAGGGARVSVGIAGHSLDRLSGDRTGPSKTEKTLPATGRVSKGELPYRRRGTCPDLAPCRHPPVGCRGFIGPVPPPLLISALQLWLRSLREDRSRAQASPDRPVRPRLQIRCRVMVDRRSLRARLLEKPLLADGAMGTLLHARGVPQRAALDDLVRTRPELIGVDPS